MATRGANPLRIEHFGDYCEQVAEAYDEAPVWEESEIWRWEKLRDSVLRMFGQVEKKVEVIFAPGNPYESADQMRKDVAKTGKLWISTDFNEHPFFTPDENLRFRAVHDYVVHILPGKGGPDFTRKGEIRAYNLHRKLAPKDTWPALFTEVAAQACYKNARGHFPVQKVAVLHGFDFYNVGWVKPKKRAANSMSAQKQRLLS